LLKPGFVVLAFREGDPNERGSIPSLN
jgi:hypothetical protein